MPLNIPNLLTWGRILLIPLFVGVFYLHHDWLAPHEQNLAATIIFIVAALTDWLDGYLARTLQQTSAFGAFLDPVADKLMVAAALIMLVQLDRADTIVAFIIIGREITISALREWMAKIGASRRRRRVLSRQGENSKPDGRHPDAALPRSAVAVRSATHRHLADLPCRAAHALVDGILLANGMAAHSG